MNRMEIGFVLGYMLLGWMVGLHLWVIFLPFITYTLTRGILGLGFAFIFTIAKLLF